MIFLFASRCPHFTVYDAELYVEKFGITDVRKDFLRVLDFLKAYGWLSKNEEAWEKFASSWEKEVVAVKAMGGNAVQWHDANYPHKLRNLFHPPAILFYRGNLSVLNEKTVSVVGSRMPTDLGRKWVQKTVPEFVQNGFTIVSGGARGIDYEAHQACLSAGGKTAVFLPGGVTKPYPASHDFLFSVVEKTGGVLISEFASYDNVRRENFHQRNRLIAGVADAVIVVEAAPQSGTMMTATKTLAENRELFVVPGSPLLKNYAGSLELICQGANIICTAEDVLSRKEKNSFDNSAIVP